MKNVLEESKCSGCTACFNICPKNAITMIENKDGFKYPVIAQDKCINCGLCKKTCPVLNMTNSQSINKCYVGYAKDDNIKKASSSGGIFPLIANTVLNDNGIVIGASFDEYNKLKHIAITKVKDLDKLKGSKYLQSDLDNIFSYITQNINDNKILFVGTPCQVAGLKAFLKKDYDNLLCIDLFCHGVPSPKLFNKYIKELEESNNDHVINYNFRDKSTGWDTYSNTIIFKNKKISELQTENDYMKLFLSDIALRESCYHCNFKLGNKYSDITLGDFWGVQNYYPEMYDKKGVSAIIVNTDKGLKIFNDIVNDLECKECKLEEIVNGNPSLVRSGLKPKCRDKFFKDINVMNVSDLSKKYTKISFVNKFFSKLKKFIKRLIKK